MSDLGADGRHRANCDSEGLSEAVWEMYMGRSGPLDSEGGELNAGKLSHCPKSVKYFCYFFFEVAMQEATRRFKAASCHFGFGLSS